MAGNKWVYFFGDGRADGDGGMKNLLGGKGAGLAEMSRLGILVPAGFTITTDVCTAYYDNRKRYPRGLEKAVEAAGVIHSDLARGFIRAECFSYANLEIHGSEKGLKEKGLIRLEGKEYQVMDGDILNIRFSV